MTWRQRFRPLVARVLASVEGQDNKTIRKAIREGFPYPYDSSCITTYAYPLKVWRDEARRQRGLKPQIKDYATKQREALERLGQMRLEGV